jgi:hypothetical protein
MLIGDVDLGETSVGSMPHGRLYLKKQHADGIVFDVLMGSFPVAILPLIQCPMFQ